MQSYERLIVVDSRTRQTEIRYYGKNSDGYLKVQSMNRLPHIKSIILMTVGNTFGCKKRVRVNNEI